MDTAVSVVTAVQMVFFIIIGMYFFNLLRSQQGSKMAVSRESDKEMDHLARLREISLTEPLAEKTRPSGFSEIVGQADGLKALRAALCGPNPQHVIIYGPPGVGKTAAARLILEEAKRYVNSPFQRDAKFVEVDATTARFDERGIADPLIGTVHDPIYQGAGAMGAAGIPQPKAGAVTKAHGGVLFIDEIGELHHIQMNKLLKVLEDRKVMLESSYYNSEDTNIPRHIHDIFTNGLPADFRLIAATTRQPQEIPEAIRSRCVEIFFRPLLPDEIASIAVNACHKIKMRYTDEAIAIVKRYAANGRDAVNIIQTAAGIAMKDKNFIEAQDVEWVVNFGQYAPRCEKKVPVKPQIGLISGMAVHGASVGALMEIEAYATPSGTGGSVKITGIIEDEEIVNGAHHLKRQSTAKSSVDNVLTVLKRRYGIDFAKYDIHVNFPGSAPVDGPSAGAAIAAAIYSAVRGVYLDAKAAVTGELSITGKIYPVGGVTAKLEAAIRAGAEKIYIPADNMQAIYKTMAAQVIPVRQIDELLTRLVVCEDGGSVKESALAGGDVRAAMGS